MTLTKETNPPTEYMGYTWDEVSPKGKALAKKLAGDLNITEIEAYQLLVEHMLD